MNRTCLSITLAIAVSLICNPAWVNAFQPDMVITRAQEQVRDSDAPRAMEERYQAEVMRVFGINNPLHEATQRLKEAESSEDKEAATEAIRTELGKQYDQFLEANERQIQELQDRLDKLREQLVRRQEAKEKMVDLELERVINESEGLVWPNSGGRGGMPGFPLPNMNAEHPNWSAEWFAPQIPHPSATPAMIPPATAPRQPARPRSAR